MVSLYVSDMVVVILEMIMPLKKIKKMKQATVNRYVELK